MGYFPESFLKGIEWVFFLALVGVVALTVAGSGLVVWGIWYLCHHLKWV